MNADKRWRHRRELWVTPADRFTPADYSVDVADVQSAKRFVESEHYSGTFPAARLAVGMYGPGARLVAVAVFSVPCQQRVIPSYTGLAANDGVELGRFVCAPSVGFNGESWFLARAFRLLRSEKPDVRAVLSYADPVERTTVGGQLTKPAHWGTIYQASNALHVGRSSPRWLYLAPDGSVISGRALTKVRKLERGWMYVARQMLDWGAAPRAFAEEPRDWLDRVLPSFRRLKHPGNLAYLFGLDRQASIALRERHAGGSSYPKAAA